MKLCELTDLCAQAECRRLLLIVNARRRQEAQWFGHDSVSLFEYDENSAFVCGMVSLFRYARGEAVPPVLVESFLDTFLNMMFCGLASGVLALPSFKKMEDRPWAMAWRLAEPCPGGGAACGYPSVGASSRRHGIGTRTRYGSVRGWRQRGGFVVVPPCAV